MVFPYSQPSRKKKSKILYRDKKGNSYADNQKAVAEAGEDLGATANETDPANPFPKPPAKIPRADKNWEDKYQVQRALNYRDNKVAKLLLKSNDLSKNKEYLKGTVHKQNTQSRILLTRCMLMQKPTAPLQCRHRMRTTLLLQLFQKSFHPK